MAAVLAEFPCETIQSERLGLQLLPAAPPVPTSQSRRLAGPSAADYRRRRVAAAGLALLVVSLAWVAVRSALDRTGGGPLATTGAVAVASRTWVVHPGDTLWSIAGRIDPGADVRPLVDRLAREVGGRPIYPGEVLSIPVP